MTFSEIIRYVLYVKKILGKYIADFYGAEANIVVELDGSQHYEDKKRFEDDERTLFLKSYGIKVVRIPNNEVNRNFVGVCEYIDGMVKQLKQSLSQQS